MGKLFAGKPAPAVQTTSIDFDRHDAFSRAVIAAVERAGPSVIGVRRRRSVGNRGADAFEGAGSGVIISSDGYALTNNHVIQGAERVDAVAMSLASTPP